MDVPRNTEPLLGIGGDNFMGKIDFQLSRIAGCECCYRADCGAYLRRAESQRPFPLRALPSGRPR